MPPDSKPKGPITRAFRSAFNLRGWADWDRLRGTSSYFLRILQRLFVLRAPKPTDIKSFEEVVAEKNLSSDDIEMQCKGLKRLTIIMLISAGCFYIYGMYELFYGGFLSVMLSLIFMFISLSFAFRYHFWCFQIRQRRLGCRFSEWFNATFVKDDKV